jgi:hypothetical protein
MPFNWLYTLQFERIFLWFLGLWNSLDEKRKKEIIEVIVKAFEQVFRAFYKWYKSRKGE